jgi:hypothetical protein
MTDLAHLQRPRAMPVALTLSEPRSGLQARRRSQSGGTVVSWKAADFYDLDGEGLEPGEQPMQSCLILERAVYHRLDWLDRGGEAVEVK